MSVGYLTDSFDLINVRDLDVIEQARELCSRLVVGVFTDAYAEELFGRAPVVPLAERIAVLQHIRGVADVMVVDSDASMPGVETDLHFAVSDVPGPQPRGTTLLTPRRLSTSPVLRNALRPVEDEAVA